jgi:hypothetical protein
LWNWTWVFEVEVYGIVVLFLIEFDAVRELLEKCHQVVD